MRKWRGAGILVYVAQVLEAMPVKLALTNEQYWKAEPSAQTSAPTHMTTHIPLCTCYGKVYRNVALEENGWPSRGKFITLLTFKLSSFNENRFFNLLHFPRCSPWYLSLDTLKCKKAELRKWTHRHTETQDNCNPLTHARQKFIIGIELTLNAETLMSLEAKDLHA